MHSNINRHCATNRQSALSRYAFFRRWQMVTICLLVIGSAGFATAWSGRSAQAQSGPVVELSSTRESLSLKEESNSLLEVDADSDNATPFELAMIQFNLFDEIRQIDNESLAPFLYGTSAFPEMEFKLLVHSVVNDPFDDRENRMLHVAVRSGNELYAWLLMQCGADPFLLNDARETAFEAGFSVPTPFAQEARDQVFAALRDRNADDAVRTAMRPDDRRPRLDEFQRTAEAEQSSTTDT
ncbi:MAG: hypothetical protein KDA91_16170 [Planctomycetaceae bacterium]|nr:hypothetical protein [Planctomycetaceae bacterium]